MSTRLPPQLLKVEHNFEAQEPEDTTLLHQYDIHPHLAIDYTLITLKTLDDKGKTITIPRKDLAELLRRNGKVNRLVLHHWLSILCEYHNIQSIPNGNTKLPRYVLFSSECFEAMDRVASIGEKPGYAYLTGELMRSLPTCTKSECRAALIHNSTEHILIPLERDIPDPSMTTTRFPTTAISSTSIDSTGVHHGLIIISFRTKVVEYLDSLHLDGRRYIFRILEWLHYELREEFHLQDWSWRQDHCPKQAPALLHADDPSKTSENAAQSPNDTKLDVARYPDGIDGGVHVAMNAWNCLYGFFSSTNHALFDSKEAIWAKRRRMAVDILRGKLVFNAVESEEKGWHKPRMQTNSYLGLVRRRNLRQVGEEWEQKFPGYEWDSSSLPHRVGLVRLSLVGYYGLAAEFERREIGDLKRRLGMLRDKTVKIRDPWWRRQLLVEMAGKIMRWDGRVGEKGASEERFDEELGWTTRVLKCFVIGWIDGRSGLYERDWDRWPEDSWGEQVVTDEEKEIERSPMQAYNAESLDRSEVEVTDDEDDLYAAD